MTEIGMALSNPYDGRACRAPWGARCPASSVDIVDDDGQRAGRRARRAARALDADVLRLPRRPEATRGGFDAEGRFRTGDTGVRDDDGDVRLLGRTSIDILKSGGYKLSALEIEEVLRDHPAVAEVAVIGVPDETWGERVTACVVAARGARPTLDELQAFARERLAPYKVPRRCACCRAAAQRDGQGAEAAAALASLTIENEYSPPSSAPNTTCATTTEIGVRP